MCARGPVRRVALERRPKPLLGYGTKAATGVSTDTDTRLMMMLLPLKCNSPKEGIRFSLMYVKARVH